MEIYIALLRGVNVSGKNSLKMVDLKNMLENMSFENIQTYIQSGNIIFSTHESFTKIELAEQISIQIKEHFSLEVPVLILSKSDLEKIINNLPFSDFIEKDIYLTYLKEPSKIVDFETIVSKKSITEEMYFLDEVIYLDCPDGYGNTKLSNVFLEKKLGILCTTRNLKTSKKLLELALNS